MECLVIGLGNFGRSVAKQFKVQGSTVVGIDNNEKALEEAESFLDEAIKLDSFIESNLRQIGVEHFDHCFVCMGNMEINLVTTLNLTNLGARKITVRSHSVTHTLLLQKIGSFDIIYPEMEIAKQVVKEALVDIESYIKIRDNMLIASIDVPKFMVHKTLKELALREHYHIQILWLDKFIPYVDDQGNEGSYEENIDFIPADYRFNLFDQIAIFGTIDNVQSFMQKTSKNLSEDTKFFDETDNETE